MRIILLILLCVSASLRSEAQLNISKAPFVAGVLKPATAAGFKTIGVDGTASSGEETTSTFTWTHTVGGGGEKVIYFGISIHDGSGVTVSSASYNSVALTKLRHDGASDATRARTEIWYLVAPDAGANTCSVTLSGTPGDASAGSISFTNVNQSTPNDVSGGAGGIGTSTAASQSITTVTDNAWTFAVLKVHNNNTITIGAAQTQLWNDAFGAVNGQAAGGRSSTAVTPAGSKTMNWTLNPSDDWALSVAAIRPASN